MTVYDKIRPVITNSRINKIELIEVPLPKTVRLLYPLHDPEMIVNEKFKNTDFNLSTLSKLEELYYIANNINPNPDNIIDKENRFIASGNTFLKSNDPNLIIQKAEVNYRIKFEQQARDELITYTKLNPLLPLLTSMPTRYNIRIQMCYIISNTKVANLISIDRTYLEYTSMINDFEDLVLWACLYNFNKDMATNIYNNNQFNNTKKEQIYGFYVKNSIDKIKD